MKKVLSIVAVLAVLAVMAMLPASAETLKGKVVLGMEGFEGSIFDIDGVKEDYASNDVGIWTVPTVEDGVVTIHNMKFEKEHFVYVPAEVTDWTGAKAYYAYVDASNVGYEIQLGLRIRAIDSTEEDIVFVAKSNRATDQSDVPFGAYKIQDASGEWVAPSNAVWNRLTLPANYKGWVKLDLGILNPQWWGNKNSEVIDLSKVTAIGFHVQGLQGNDAMTLSDFAIDGVNDTDITIIGEPEAGEKTDDKGGDKEPEKKPAKTGEAAPIAAAVTAVLAAGAVVALRKRSK